MDNYLGQSSLPTSGILSSIFECFYHVMKTSLGPGISRRNGFKWQHFYKSNLLAHLIIINICTRQNKRKVHEKNQSINVTTSNLEHNKIGGAPGFGLLVPNQHLIRRCVSWLVAPLSACSNPLRHPWLWIQRMFGVRNTWLEWSISIDIH